jgi:hypothetical protein
VDGRVVSRYDKHANSANLEVVSVTIILVTDLQDWKYMQRQNMLYELLLELSTNFDIIPETISPFSYASVVTLVTQMNRRTMGVKVQCLKVQND